MLPNETQLKIRKVMTSNLQCRENFKNPKNKDTHGKMYRRLLKKIVIPDLKFKLLRFTKLKTKVRKYCNPFSI